MRWSAVLIPCECPAGFPLPRKIWHSRPCFGEYFAPAVAIDKIFVHVLKLVARPLPWRNRVERRAIQFLVVAVRDSNRAALSIQIRAHHTQFACELIGSVRGDLQITECKPALIPAVVPNHEIKIIVRHPKPSLRFALHTTSVSPGSLVQLAEPTLNCRDVLHFGSLTINRRALVDTVNNFAQRRSSELQLVEVKGVPGFADAFAFIENVPMRQSYQWRQWWRCQR